MASWLLHFSELTPEQQRVVEFPPKENRLVVGPPGSGKTQVLIHRAYHLAQSNRLGSEQYRVFVFTNVVKEYIKSGLRFLNIPEETVSTFDHWCRLMYEAHISRRLPFRYKNQGIDFARIRQDVLDLLRRQKKLQHHLAFVLVDEGQDLTSEAYEILSLAAQHITVFADPQQQIFEEGVTENHLLNAMGLSRRNAVLLAGYRNAPYVAQLASHFIADPQSRSQYLAQMQTEQKVRERPLCFIASDWHEELGRLAEIIQSRVVKNERIGIIVETNDKLHGFAKGLEERGVEVEKAIPPDFRKTPEAHFDFDNPRPKIVTYFSAKGLTFDTVLMPRLHNGFLSWVGRGVPRQRIYFVGISRATQWVYLSLTRGNEPEEMGLLRNAEKEGHLTIQTQWVRGVMQEPQDKTAGADDDFSVL